VKRGVNFALSLASSVLLILCFPRFNFTWLAPVAIAPLLVACAREASWKRRFLNGWAAGFVFWFGVCYWIQFVLEVHGGLGRWLAWATFLLFAILKGLHLALFAALAGWLMPRWFAIPAVAAWWTGIERTHGPLGFAWLDLGNAGIDMPVAARLAPLNGVYGLSFVFAMLGCAVALMILRRPRRELLWLVVLALLPVLTPLPPPRQGAELVRVVQPNLDTEAEWTNESVMELQRNLLMLSRTSDVPLVVWPEAPAPFYPGTASFQDFLEQVTRGARASLLMNGVARTAAGEPLNSAFFVDSSGTILDRYDQINLVPFGEFVPPLFVWMNRITKEAGDFVPGKRVVTFPLGGHHIGAFICYEAAFPDLVRQFPRDGAEALVNLSNDGYFGTSDAAREQHLELARMRAAENQRWILFATNDGITAMIDPAGRIRERLRPYRTVAATMRYGYGSGLTLYTRYGAWFAWGCLILSCLALGFAAKSGANKSGAN
jgi:apolipoprotein N-acyltransferase